MTLIREAVPEDAAVVTGLLRALAETLGEGAKFRSTEALIRQHGFGPNRRLWSLLTVAGPEAIGLATYFPTFSTTRGAPGVYLQDLYVMPEARGRGLGEQLLRAVIRDVEVGWGATHLTLLVYDANRGARRFYQRLGFSLADTERPALLDGAAFKALRSPS
jgi:ribosomal protein S18 acetylase RimI-like enzyme